MYSKLPNLTIGFHGCDISTYERILYQNKPLRASTNPYDWLGHGIYFWENNYQRALKWAEEQVKRGKYTTPKVIGAVIDLGHCLNLTDSAFIPLVRQAYEITQIYFESVGDILPKNKGGSDLLVRDLDCAVIEQLHTYIETVNYLNRADDKPIINPFDSVRGVFIEGKEVYPTSGFREKTHVQICVRNPNCIKGYFNPIEENKCYPMP